MVFSFVFTNCHLPSFYAKKTANLTTNRLKRHIITHFCCVLLYANITLCFRLSKSFSENFFFSCPNVEEECEKARYGSPKCLTMASTNSKGCLESVMLLNMKNNKARYCVYRRNT